MAASIHQLSWDVPSIPPLLLERLDGHLSLNASGDVIAFHGITVVRLRDFQVTRQTLLGLGIHQLCSFLPAKFGLSVINQNHYLRYSKGLATYCPGMRVTINLPDGDVLLL